MGDYWLLGILGVKFLISTGGYSSARLMSVNNYWLLGVLGVFLRSTVGCSAAHLTSVGDY